MTSLSLRAQVQLERSVIGSTGGSSSAAFGSISHTTGEVATETDSSSLLSLTQGFHQPLIIDQLGFSVISKNESCNGASDGYAEPFEVSWSTGDTTLRLDSVPMGTYTVIVNGVTEDCQLSKKVQVGIDDPNPCKLETFNAFSPDGDKVNDKWVIENISEFQSSSVTIYNRWGDELNSFKDYDNKNVVWNGRNNSGNLLPSGIYFYVIKVTGDNGAQKEQSGWVQITR
ncbi:MAG: gliding motility-associated C-terminal domain-containing protein [Flavobacteriales bacterium]